MFDLIRRFAFGIVSGALSGNQIYVKALSIILSQ